MRRPGLILGALTALALLTVAWVRWSTEEARVDQARSFLLQARSPSPTIKARGRPR